MNIPSKQTLYANLFVWSLCALPLIAFVSARSMAILPGIMALIFAALWPVFYKEKLQIPKPYLLWSGLIVALCALSTIWAPDMDFTLEKTGKIALVLFPGALLFCLAQSLKPEHLSGLVRALPVSIGIAATLIALELAFDLPFHHLTGEARADGFISRAVVNRSIFCALSLSFIALGFIRASAFPDRKKQILIAGMFGCAALALLLSESQSNQLAIILAAIVLFAFPYRWRPAWYIFGAIMAILIMSAPWLAHSMYPHLAADTESLPWLREGYAATRMEIWDFVARRILENPLVGYGADSTRVIIFENNQLFYHSNTVLHPHNFVLQLWAELGIAGALAGSAFFIYLFHHMSRLSVETAKIALPTLIYVLMVGAVGYGVWQGWWLGQITLILAFYIMALKPRP